MFAQEGRRDRGGQVEETVAITLVFDNGLVGQLLMTDNASSPFFWESATGENPAMPRQGQPVLTIVGSQGSISVPELRQWHGVDWWHELEADDRLAQGIDTSRDLFDVQLDHFYEVIRHNAQPVCSGQDGIAALLVLEAIRESMASGVPVNVESI